MGYEPGSLFFYKPSFHAAVACACIFLVLGTLHAWRTFRSHSWRFTSLAVICAAEITTGFVLRALGSTYYTSIGLFIGEEVCIQIGPPVLALALYLTLGRTLYYIPYLSPIHPGRVRTTFVGLDAVCGALIGAGAAMFGNTDMTLQQREIGASLVKAGMVLQCVLVTGFIALCSVFYWRCRKAGLGQKVERIMGCLYACAGCILFRTIIRTAIFFQGYLGVLYTREVYFYCLDTLWIIFAMVVFLVLFPASHLPKSEKIYLALDGETEKEGPGWDDRRHWVITCFDPCDLIGLCVGTDRRTRFWEEGDSPARDGEPSRSETVQYK